jgi:hypothetical protein
MAYRSWEFGTREYRESVQYRHAWECPLCGELFHGDRVPDECPVCMAPGSSFIRVTPENTPPAPERVPVHEHGEAGAYTRKDGSQWSMSIKSWRLWAHPRPV